MRMRIGSSPLSALRALSMAKSARICSAASIARSAEFSHGSGAPQNASSPSPMYLSSVPPFSSTGPVMQSKNSRVSSTISSSGTLEVWRV